MFLLKKKKRKLAKLDYALPIIYGIVGLGTGYLLFMSWITEIHQIWLTRFVFFLLGFMQTAILLKRNWVVRDKFYFEKDSFFPEFLFTLSLALITAVMFVLGGGYSLSGQSIYLDPSPLFGDLPLYFVLPFFWIKLFDMAGHIPPETIAEQWSFPLEPVSAQNWPWRELMIVNFEMKKSLVEEYNIFAEEARPWIEAPREISLGAIFQLCMQERRRNKSLTTIQDLGDEYDGEPRFYWLFLKKSIWYKPRSWRRENRLLDPVKSIRSNGVESTDIIIARRIPGRGQMVNLSEDESDMGEDSNKTVIIRR